MRIRLLAVAALAVVLTGCGQAEPAAPPPPVAPAPEAPAAPPSASAGGDVELGSSPTLIAIKQRKRLLVGVRADQPKFVTRDPAGEYRGFDVDIARDIARRIGLDPNTQVQFRRLPPTLLRDAVAAGNVDVLLGGTADVPQLAEIPYAVTDTERNLVVKADDPELAEELRGMLRAAIADGTWQRAHDQNLAPQGISARP
ncbi:transporter substrate-binding domain-containing protein [Saccharopolyspora aridisoli]|uniref:Transporter substrate-binding domain-containing protein n=1 Tax=Saccharopolyspora aridisoli TaxID=2530385 RepID=A0A4R4UST7_9PSEU|nr:transporter substrate-binding domain-containing protein [Saccharopolyspora aridisoli]TDC95141.1 transporter substrate-binding domain-containing protein [Saccharopolyspora aridisoli]